MAQEFLKLHRTTRYAKRIRAKLVEQLGGKCFKCDESDPDKLQFDHINGRDYNPNKLSYSARMKRYEREAQRGELRLACETHNLEARVKNDNGRHIRTEHAASVTRTSHMDFANDNPF